jgi:hypothetical protein
MVSFPFRAYRREANHRVASRPSVGGSEVCCRPNTRLFYHEGGWTIHATFAMYDSKIFHSAYDASHEESQCTRLNLSPRYSL